MTFRRLMIALAAAITLGSALIQGQVPGRNVNMVSGRTLPEGDPFLQRQNEPSIAASTRNPLHLLAGANDYRTVDLPGLPDDVETGDAWMGLFKSTDGGNTWRSNLIPGYPQDIGSTSPLRNYQAAADPVVRAGTNGLFFYSGLVFDRATAANPAPKSALFVTRFIDNNNKEAGDPIVYLGTTLVATNPGTAFIDKPWFAVDIPRLGSPICSITTTQPNPTPGSPTATVTQTQQFPGGAAYVVYSLIAGEGTSTKSQLFFSRSGDCGVTWSAPLQISSSLDPVNQGSTIAIDPRTGTISVAWRRFSSDGTDDTIMVVRSSDQGRKWDPPGRARRFPRGKKIGLRPEMHGKKFNRPVELADLTSLDQPTGPDRFRSNAYPTMAIDAQGRVYVAWAERGFAPIRPDPDDGDARVVVASSTDGVNWTAPAAVDNGMVAGHQLMPSLTFAGGKLMVAYYDLREDQADVFSKFVDETNALFVETSTGTFTPRSPRRRHTLDVRAAQASPAASPIFASSVQVSEYLRGSRANSLTVEQLQFNPPNLKLFKLGGVPFIGDYIDLAPSPAFVPATGGGWAFNTAASSSPLFHAVWADNRDVIPPPDGNWANYTPPNYPVGETRPNLGHAFAACAAGRAGMRNQNIYTARITGGLVAGSPGNSKTLSSTLPRGFVIYAQNATEQTRTFALTITNQPVGGRASFDQFPLPPYTSLSPAPLTTLQVSIPRRSTIARTVYAVSSDSHAQINVSVTELSGVGGQTVQDGLSSVVILNPDISNPDISNPDISNPDISNPDISNAEVHNPDISNPDISNPDISNPDISNPDISNPDISNPDISNVVIANPDISNPDISNPDISNPDISNPDISNPDISNPDISNQSLTDTTWKLTNEGNTATAYSVKLLLNGTQLVPDSIIVQLVLRKIYKTPTLLNCEVVNQRNNVLLANILNPQFTTLSQVANPDISNPDISNATLSLAPGETAQITLRVMDKNIHDAVTFNAAEQVVPVVQSQALNVSLVDGVLVVAPQVAVAISTPILWSANGHFYEYVKQGGLSWSQANAAAEAQTFANLRGHLVTITSAEENAFVEGLRFGGPLRAWIGLQDPNGTGVENPLAFQWVTGELFGIDYYDSWAPGEPNNPGSEFWVEMFTGGTWNNNQQLDPIYPTLGYIVEYEPFLVGQLSDPAGDATASGQAFSPDLVSSDVIRTSTALVFQVRFAPGTFNAPNTLAQLLLDTDRSPATGHPGVNSGCVADAAIIGSEFLIDVQGSAGTVKPYAGTCNVFTNGPAVGVVTVADGYDITVPLAAIGNDDGVLNFKVTVAYQISANGYTGVLDYMSNVGLSAGTTAGGGN